MSLDKDKKRFHPEGLDVGEGIQLPHFKPIDGIIDQFGNRLFSSKLKNFWDTASRKKVKASLLVSPRGQEFIRANIGVLRDIEAGLASQEPKPKRAQISPDRSIMRWNDGAQSIVYLLTVGPQKFVLKTPNAMWSYSQPYVNEMLQTQTVEREFADFLDEHNIEMSRFLFASGHLSCTELVEGVEADPKDLYPFVSSLNKKLMRFIRENRRENPLWAGGVMPDLIKFFPTTQVRVNNFIKKPDGRLVWIDPFFIS